MLGTDITTVSWPACGEVDIMENIGKEPSTVHGTVHGPGYSGANGIGAPYALPNGQKFSDDYHIFSVIWTSTSVEFFVDSHSYQKVTLSSLPPGTKWVFNTPFFIILNVAVGGGWPGYPDNTTSFPQTMLVDYVRVYQATAPPAINTGGITNGASFTSALSPGSLASVFGTGLSDNTQSDLFDPSQNLFPQASGGTSVLVNGLSMFRRHKSTFRCHGRRP
jgi:beta-glucanase (GH16 family)